MQKLFRPQTFPYAASSTGAFRGLLMRKYPCWDARGPARDLFATEIAGKIKACLEQWLPESDSFIGFSLFMVGKVPEKTKPTIMIVSDDKPRRKEAFQIVKTRTLNHERYLGFEVGHCSVAAEFEDLRQLGSDTSSPEERSDYSQDSGEIDYMKDVIFLEEEEILHWLSTDVCALEWPDWMHPTRLYFHTSPNLHSHTLASATCGGLFEYQDNLFALTTAHAIYSPFSTVGGLKQPKLYGDSSSESDDFEITGMDDWSDEDDGEGDAITLTAITSPGSKTPSEVSEFEEGQQGKYDSHRSSEISIRTRVPTAPPLIHEVYCEVDDYDGGEDDLPETCHQIGSIVSIDQTLDLALIKISSEKSVMDMPPHQALRAPFPLDISSLWYDDDLTDTSVFIKTTHHPSIKGRRSEMPFYTRLPGMDCFMELQSVQLDIPLRPGDSGSWAFNSNWKPIGCVIAGSPKTGSCLLSPIGPALQSMYKLLQSSRSDARIKPKHWAGLTPAAPRFDIPSYPQDEDAMTTASSAAPPSIFSNRMDRGTPFTMAYSPVPTPHVHSTKSPEAEGSLLQGEVGSASGLASKDDFWKHQSIKLRRELGRAWEIIQEKDQQLQELLPGTFAEPPPPPRTPFIFSGTTKPSTPSFTTSFADTGFNVIDANEALAQENQELKRGIAQAMKAIHEVRHTRRDYDYRERLVKITLDLERVLNNTSDLDPNPSLNKVKTEPESKDIVLTDLPPYMGSDQVQSYQLDNLPYRKKPQKLPSKRIPRTVKSRLTSPFLASQGQGPSLSEGGRDIDTVMEVDEEDPAAGGYREQMEGMHKGTLE
ncbi:hypothetical protein F5Y19DRAFT_480411 [Xylariaceae sp. FL1651]|nr:hypothetical protein F5Y19DRAFT_480411 [Xylariaceae sp. FL1651]